MGQVKEKNPNVKIMTIVFDFAEYVTIQDYQSKIADKLKDIDLAVLFLNAGYL